MEKYHFGLIRRDVESFLNDLDYLEKLVDDGVAKDAVFFVPAAVSLMGALGDLKNNLAYINGHVDEMIGDEDDLTGDDYKLYRDGVFDENGDDEDEAVRRLWRSRRWNVDMDVKADDDDGNPVEVTEADKAAIEKTLRGEYHIGWDGWSGITFFADDADWSQLQPILDGLKARGCRVVECYEEWEEAQHEK